MCYYQQFFPLNNDDESFEPIINQDFYNFNAHTVEFFTYQNQKQSDIPNPNYFSVQINQKTIIKSNFKFQTRKNASTNNNKFIFNTQELFKFSKKRLFKNIHTLQCVKQAHLSTTRGTKNQTTELNINIKTLTKNFLMESILLREFNTNQIQKIYTYARGRANFLNTQQLFGVEKSVEIQDDIKTDNTKKQYQQVINVTVKTDANRIRRKCFEHYSSSGFIKCIFKAEKMGFKSKLTIIKFMKNIRESPVFPQDLKKWKMRT